jgi:hypothetical protein
MGSGKTSLLQITRTPGALYFSLVITVLLVSASGAFGQALPDSFSVRDKEDAYNTAVAITGFAQDLKSGIEIDRVVTLDTLVHDRTPFEGHLSDSDQVWVVRFPSHRLDISGWADSYVSGQKLKTFTVTIDARSGRLIRIIGQVDTLSTFFYDKADPESLERLLRGCGEVWSVCPDNVAIIPLSRALEVAVPSSPLMATEIHAVCVNWINLQEEPRPVWMITGNGFPKVDKIGQRARCVIDARTGKLLTFMNYP